MNALPVPLKRLRRAPPPDCLDFIRGYPSQPRDASCNKNLRFYRGDEAAQPDGLRIEGMLGMLEANYEECEANHGWVQWLYPIRTPGVNPLAQALQPHEVKAITSDASFQPLVTRAYTLFLSFLGISKPASASSLLERARVTANSAPGSSFEERAANIRSHPHNLLRLTRLLKWLNEMQREADARSLLLFMLAEREAYGWSDVGWSGRSAFKSSLCEYYVWCFRTQSVRDEVMQVVDQVLCGETFDMKRYRSMMGAGD